MILLTNTIKRSPETMVTILVGAGDNKAKFVVHKDFVCHYSLVFRAAFNGVFIEGQSQIYYLRDEREKVVGLLVEWIYTKDISSSNDRSGYDDLVELWILADKLCIPDLQDNVIDRLKEMNFKPADVKALASQIGKVYRGTSDKSQLRNFAVAECASHFKPRDIILAANTFHKSFPVDYMDYIYDKVKLCKSVTWTVCASKYHVSESKPSGIGEAVPSGTIDSPEFRHCLLT